MKTSEELEKEALDVANTVEAAGDDDVAEIIRELTVRYRAARITANNYKKALEALEHA